MNESHFRVIFEGLDAHAHLARLVVYLQKELSLSQEVIRNLLTNPPRVLWPACDENTGRSVQSTLEKLGCKAFLEPIRENSGCPFPISESHYKLMHQELSKILRVRANLALFLIQIAAAKPGVVLPSMMGPLKEKISECFRESDTVIGVDDTRLIVLGFSTDKEGVTHLESKTNRMLADLLGDDLVVTTGYALFPSEGRNVGRLIQIAEEKRKKQDKNPDGETPSPAEHTATAIIEVEADGDKAAFERCFVEARGKVLRRLAALDPEVLWFGLSRLPEAEQRGFLGRLPFDSPLCPVLEQMINSQRPPVAGQAAERQLQGILDHMEFTDAIGNPGRIRDDIVARLTQVDALPTLPSVAAHIFKIASNPNASAEDLTRVIVNDPPLTSKLLRIVNSAFYGFPQKISTVKQVVVILGTEEITDLAFGLAAARVFEFKSVGGLCDPKALWRHSLGTALIAQDLCQRHREQQKQGAFTAGLLHDFGKIFLIENFSEVYEQIHHDAAEQALPPVEVEEDHLGLSHAVIGEALASNWNLPVTLVQAIAFHHQPLSATEHAELAALVGLADYLHHQTDTMKDSAQGSNGVPAPILSYGHWYTLKNLLQGLDGTILEDMAGRSQEILDQNSDLFAILG
ncbi:MAG: HDOD domain-containing protein [Deltaproteobacteria bacterium]|nr:HDOD domain-containing protein [Deltaproteobacteria bacterium]